MSESLIDAREMDHIRWVAVYGGGDELADANCWKDAKPALAPLLEIADLAWEVVAANYETAGEDALGKQTLWTKIADLEQSLRRLDYGK